MTQDRAGLVGADVTPRISGVSAPMRPSVFRVEAQLPELNLVILPNVFSSCLRGGRKGICTESFSFLANGWFTTD